MSNLARHNESSLATREAKAGDLTVRLGSLISANILDAGADLLTRRFLRNRKDAIELGSKGLSLALIVAGGLLAPEFLGVGLTGKIALSLAGSLIAHIGNRWKQDIEFAQREDALTSTIRKFERTDTINAISYAQAESLRAKLPHRRPSMESQDRRIATIAETLDGLIGYVETLGNPQLNPAVAIPNRFNWGELKDPDRHPHILILGATGDGKTWIGEWIADLLGDGHDLKVITTKRKRDQWRGMPVTGVGRNFTQIEREFDGLLSEMTRRCSRLDEVENLPQLIRPVDELPAIAENIEGEKDTKSGKPKGLSTYTKPLILEARETRIRLILHAQGKQVRLLGFEGISDCLDSLTIVRLGKMAIDHAESLLKRKLITESDFEWIRNQPRPVTLGDAIAEYPRPDNWRPTGHYVSIENDGERDNENDVFGHFPDSSLTGISEDRQSEGEDSNWQGEDSVKTDGKGSEDDFTRFAAILDNPPNSPIFDTLTPEGRLFTLRIMLFRNMGVQEIIRLAWGHRSGGKNYHLYQAARQMLDRMIEDLNAQGFNSDNNWGLS